MKAAAAFLATALCLCGTVDAATTPFFELVPAQARTAKAGKIELRIQRFYMDESTPAFEQALAEWLKTAHPDVEVVFARGLQSPVDFLTAKMDMTLRSIKRSDLTGLPYYRWIHEPDHEVMYRALWGYLDKEGIARLNLEFARANDIDAEVFIGIYQSRILDYQVDCEVSRSGPQMQIVIDGLYATSLVRIAGGDAKKAASPENLKRAFETIEALIELRRKAAASKS